MAPPKIPSPEICEIIRNKKSRYCRYADTGMLESHFHEIALADATFEFRGDNSDQPIEHAGVKFSWPSRDGFVGFFGAGLRVQDCIHVVGPGELEQVGPDEVKAVFSVMYSAVPKGDASKKPSCVGGGYYHETWKRVGDDWFMASLSMQSTIFGL